MLKKKFQHLTLLLLFFILFIGCSNRENSASSIKVTSSLAGKPILVGNIPCSFPLVNEPTKLSILSSRHGDSDYNNNYVWNQYEKMTGVDVEWTTVTRNDRAEAVSNALMNKQDIDLILRCKLSANRLTQYGESGLIFNLVQDDMLQTYAPNCWSYLQSHPDALASVMNPDGSIYALPQINSGAELRVSRKLFINKTWLKNVNMDIPATTEEFYQLLKAFKEQDANKNGDFNDEIPFCSQDFLSIQETFYGAFGLGNRGLHNFDIDYDEAKDTVRMIAATDGYRDFLAYFNQLYSEKLLDNSIFTISAEQWNNNAENDQIGVFASTNLASLPADKVDNWIAVEDALEGPNGDKLWSAIRANFHSTGAAVIPTTCEHPELILQWLDYFWTDEGTLFYHMGIEGETFIAKEDGTYDYTPELYNEMTLKNLTFDDMVANYSPYPGGSNPTVETAPYFMGGEMAAVPAAAAKNLFTYGPKEYWPSFTFTAAENDILGTIQSDISKYCASMRIDFITSAKPLSEWENYTIQLEKLKTSEMLTVYQAAFDRYKQLIAQPK